MKPGQLDALLAAFSVEGALGSCDPLGGGYIHQTWRVVTNSSDVVAQAVNRTVFRDLEACEHNLSRIDRHFADSTAIAIPRARRTEAERVHWIDNVGVAWRVTDFVAHTVAGTLMVSASDAWEAGAAYGAYASWLNRLPGGPLRETIPSFHDLDFRVRGFDAAVSEDRLGRSDMCEDVIKWAGQLLANSEVCGPLPGLASTSAHNDAKVANLRFDDRGRAVCVVDLDTTMPGSVLFDVGELIRTGAVDASEDSEELASIAVHSDRMRAIVDGFRSTAGNLVDAATLARVGIAGPRMAIENAIRFLADHLDGDRYFAVQRPGDNLIRARSQLQVAELLLEQRLRGEGS